MLEVLPVLSAKEDSRSPLVGGSTPKRVCGDTEASWLWGGGGPELGSRVRRAKGQRVWTQREGRSPLRHVDFPAGRTEWFRETLAHHGRHDGLGHGEEQSEEGAL